MASDTKSSSCCSCTFKCFCCFYCLSFCTVAIAIGIFIAIVASNFETPTFGLSSVTPTNFSLTTSEAEMTFDVKMNASNPNDWPITGTLKTVTITVYSLDKEADDGVGDLLSMSTAYLPEEVTLETNSVTIFSVFMNFVIKASTSDNKATLIARLGRDCNSVQQLVGDPTTKIRLVFSDVSVDVWGIDADFSGFELPFDMLINCDGSSATTTEVPQTGDSETVVTTTTEDSSLVGILVP